MRFVLILLIALALTLTWQSTVLAGVAAGAADMAIQKGSNGSGKKASGDEEPECE